jgi:hypothetical protein
MPHDLPYTIQVNPFVRVYQNVSETGHETPWNLRMRFAVRLGNSLRRFTNDLKIADHGVLKHRIVLKFFLAILSLALDFLRALQNVGEVDARIFLHKGLASFKMRRRSNQ